MLPLLSQLVKDIMGEVGYLVPSLTDLVYLTANKAVPLNQTSRNVNDFILDTNESLFVVGASCVQTNDTPDTWIRAVRCTQIPFWIIEHNGLRLSSARQYGSFPVNQHPLLVETPNTSDSVCDAATPPLFVVSVHSFIPILRKVGPGGVISFGFGGTDAGAIPALPLATVIGSLLCIRLKKSP